MNNIFNMNTNRRVLRFGHSRLKYYEHKEAQHFTIGKILGDGHINKKNQLEIDHSDRNYTVWNKGETLRLNLSTPVAGISEVSRKRVDKETNKTTYHNSFRTYSKALFSEYRDAFYIEKRPTDPTFGRDSPFRKWYPEDLPDLLTSLYAVSIFYMDDGGLQSGSAFISTGEVPTDEILFLQDIFKTNFNLHFVTARVGPKLATENYVYKGLYLKWQSQRDFYNFIAPTVLNVPCMHYKLNFLPS